MKTAIQRTKWTSLGLLLALSCGTPAVADDTELLLINPNEDTQTTPNVLFVIDSSGSMGSNSEQTRKVYDGAQAYAGACDPNYYYWTPYKDVRPSCATTNYRFEKSAFMCASGAMQLNGIGSSLHLSLYIPFVYVTTTRFCLSASCDKPEEKGMVGILPCKKECQQYTLLLRTDGRCDIRVDLAGDFVSSSILHLAPPLRFTNTRRLRGMTSSR